MNRTSHNNRLASIAEITMSGLIVTAVCVGILAGGPVLAQSSGQYELSWSTIDGGGARSAGGPYVLTGTIGQPDADWSEGGDYEVLGGFWPGGPLCFVQFDDFARFADYWLLTGTGLPADLDNDDDVDFGDLEVLTDHWLFSCPYAWPF